MKIAAVYPYNTQAAWSCTEGITSALRRMGHEVFPVRLENQSIANQRQIALPELGDLAKLDAIILCGLEHFWRLLDGAYGKAAWQKLAVPKLAWFHESAMREDGNPITPDVFDWADEFFFPAAQDAEFFDQEQFAGGRSHWLPFGVDTEMFRPWSRLIVKANPAFAESVNKVIHSTEYLSAGRVYGCAFIGGIYPKRASFLQRLARHLNGVDLLIGGVEIKDLSGTLLRDQTQLYAENIRQIKVFVNLPAYSQLNVTKVSEVLACGTFLLTPALEGPAVPNMALFKHKEHLLYYSETNLAYIAQLMRDWSSDERAAEREKVAAAGCAEVHARHTLEDRLLVMLEKVGAKAQATVV